MTAFPVYMFPSIETAPRGPNNIRINPPSCLLISCFTVNTQFHVLLLIRQFLQQNFLVIL